MPGGPDARVVAAMDERGTWVSRLVWLVLLAGTLFVVITATQLTPDPIGHGTHTQLGLPPCGFYLYSGLPCPGCGLTTCFSHMVRFEWVGAARANPFGVALFLVTVAGVPVSAYGLLRGRAVMPLLDRLQMEKVSILLAVCSLMVWGIRIAVMLAQA